MKYLTVLIECVFTKIQRFFGYKKSIKPIPNNISYCYDENLKTCKYYRMIDNYYNACTFIGYIGDDILLNDQCKICGENEMD